MTVLDRIDKPLLPWLCERYPVENVAMLGECVIVPAQRLPKEFEERLKADGQRIRYQGHNGQACVFIALDKQNNSVTEDSSIQKEVDSEQKPDSDSKPSPAKHWTPTPAEKETLKTLHGQGLSAKEIAEKLGKTVFQVAAVVRHLGLNPSKRGRQPKTNTDTPIQERKEEEEKPENPDLIKEYLAAASFLYPQFKRASVLLLSEAQQKIMEN